MCLYSRTTGKWSYSCIVIEQSVGFIGSTVGPDIMVRIRNLFHGLCKNSDKLSLHIMYIICMKKNE